MLSLMLALAGCGGDAATKPARVDDDDEIQSSCGGRDKCATRPDDGDAGDDQTTPGVDASHPSPSTPDGSVPGDASTPAAVYECPLEDNDDVCSTCLKFSCCEEIIKCGPACQELVQCANKCPSTSPTDACAQRCFDAHPEGMATFTAFAGCVGVQCEEACASTR